MKIRVAVAALAALAVVGVPAVAQAEPARPVAILIDVDVIRPYQAGPPNQGANCTNAGAESGTWTPTGWTVSSPRTATFNTTTLPANLNLSATVSALQSSFSAWSAASPAPAINVVTSTTSATTKTANRSNEIMFGKAGGTTLAVTYTWQWSDGLIESDMVFNTQFAWGNLGAEGDGCYESAGNVYDVANIGTHEAGHVYGLGHPSGARFETMYATGFSGETLKRSLASGDRAGANALY